MNYVERLKEVSENLRDNVVEYLKLKKEQKENETYEKKATEIMDNIEKEE